MSSPRVKAFKREASEDWKPTIGEVVFVRTGNGLRRVTAKGTIIAKALHSACFEILLKRRIGCCDVRKRLVFFQDDMRPS